MSLALKTIKSSESRIKKEKNNRILVRELWKIRRDFGELAVFVNAFLGVFSVTGVCLCLSILAPFLLPRREKQSFQSFRRFFRAFSMSLKKMIKKDVIQFCHNQTSLNSHCIKQILPICQVGGTDSAVEEHVKDYKSWVMMLVLDLVIAILLLLRHL